MDKHFILYVADGEIYQAGPFEDAPAAIKWCEDNESKEFDIDDQHVYHLMPDGRIQELYAQDIGRFGK